MKIVIPMAGMGKRMRPHTLTTPKPLLPIAGKPIVQHLVEDIAKVCDEEIEEVGFIIGDFGKEVEAQLIAIAESIGAIGKIYYQLEALGTGHAILCAAGSLEGKVTVAFADTLFRADFKMDVSKDGIIWVQQVDDPSAFGVVKMDGDTISDFVEKPADFVSDLAIIGIYYFKDGAFLRNELQYLIDNDVIKSGEYQLTDALQNMMKKGTNFYAGQVDEWLDCGNKNATVNTNSRVLDFKQNELTSSSKVTLNNAKVIEPCYIADNVVIENSTVGPNVSIGENSTISNSTISNSLIQSNTVIQNASFKEAMIGNYVEYNGESTDLSIGDYTTIK